MAKKHKGSLLVPTHGGLNKQRYKQKGSFDTLRLEEGKTKPIMFCGRPDDKKMFKEVDYHRWKEDKKTYHQVPCLGEDVCPLDEDDDDDISATSYQFLTCVYDLKERKYLVYRAGKLAAGVIALRFKKFVDNDREDRWTKTVWDITRMPGSFQAPDIERSDVSRVKLDSSKFINLDDWLVTQVKNFYGDDLPTASSLDEDDDDEDDQPSKKKKKSKSRR